MVSRATDAPNVSQTICNKNVQRLKKTRILRRASRRQLAKPSTIYHYHLASLRDARCLRADTSRSPQSAARSRCASTRLDRVSIARDAFRFGLVTDDSSFFVRQAAGAFYGPSALEVYTAESSLATAERKLAAVKALARDDEQNFAKARSRWSAVTSAFKDASERYRRTKESLDTRLRALEQAKRAYEDTKREVDEAACALAEAEKDEAEANLTLARARQKLGTHEEAIAQAKVEVQKLKTVAEAAIKKMNALKLPTF